MSHKDTDSHGHPKKTAASSKNPLRTDATPLQPSSGNEQKKRDGSFKGTTSADVSRPGAPGGSTKSHRSQKAIATQAETLSRSKTQGQKFLTLDVWGTFNFKKAKSAIFKSHMASSSQVPPVTSGGSSRQELRPLRLNVFGDYFYLCTRFAFNIGHGEIAYCGVFDSGAVAIFVNGSEFNTGTGSNRQSKLSQSLISEDKYVRAGFMDPTMGSQDAIRGLLHKCPITLGSEGSISVKEQSFYVFEELPVNVLIGTGPPSDIGLHGHTIREAPTLLQSIAKQYCLKEIMAVDIAPWNDDLDETDSDTLKGSVIHYGGADESRFDKASLSYVKGSTEGDHFNVKVKGVEYAKLSGERLPISKGSALGLLDSGSPVIWLSKDMWKAFTHCLEQDKIEVFEYGANDTRIEERSLRKLRDLVFHFADEDNKPFSISIPPEGQVFPPSLGKLDGVPEGQLRLCIAPAPEPYDLLLLGIPFFQRCYVIFDLTTSPYRIGLAKKRNTNYVNPSLKKIMNKYSEKPPAAQKRAAPGGEGSEVSTRRKK